jgi:hypothetical protein
MVTSVVRDAASSFPHALAQGMHHRKIILEMNRMGCNVIF